MEREIMPDYAAEAFFRYLIPESVFAYPEKDEAEADPCAVSCQKAGLHLFDISAGKEERNF